MWPKTNKLNYYPLPCTAWFVCERVRIPLKSNESFSCLYDQFLIFNCKLRIVSWRFCEERSVRECVCAFIRVCMCVCGAVICYCRLWYLSWGHCARLSRLCPLFVPFSQFFPPYHLLFLLLALFWNLWRNIQILDFFSPFYFW